jgi:type II secretory pathway pseudopilin PulG
MQELFVIRQIAEGRKSYFVMNDRHGQPIFTPLYSHAHVFEKKIAEAYQFFISRLYPEIATVEVVRLEDRRRIAGFSVLELAVAMFIATTLLAMALPNARTLTLYAQRRQALSQVQSLANAEATLATCTAIRPPVACPIPAVIPAPGSLTTGGYEFVFTSSPGTAGTPMQYSSSRCSWPSGMPNQPYSSTQNAANGYPECSSMIDNQIGGCMVVDVNSWSAGTNLLTCPSALPTPGTPAAWTYTAVPANGDQYSYYADQTGVLRYDVAPNTAGPSSPLE